MQEHTWHQSSKSRAALENFLAPTERHIDSGTTKAFMHHQCLNASHGTPCGAITVFSYDIPKTIGRYPRLAYDGSCYACFKNITEFFADGKNQGLGWPFANTQFGSPFRVMKVVSELEASGRLTNVEFKLVPPSADFPSSADIDLGALFT